MNSLRVLYRTALFQLRRATDRPRVMPLSMILSMTHRCQARCKTCSIWKEYIRNPEEEADELKLGEWERVFASIGTAPLWFTLSGGNQFLRKDFPAIVEALMRHCRPEIVNIPVSGLDPAAVRTRMADIAAASDAYATRVMVNLSMDGLAATHDRVRGTKGDFANTVETFHLLQALRRDHPLLNVGVYSVISSFNVREIPEVADFVTDILKPDAYTVEIAEPRDEFNVSRKIVPDMSAYLAAVDYVERKAAVHRRDRTHRLKGALRRRYHEIVRRQLVTGRAEIPCFAGVASAQITPHGKVWSCCTTVRDLGDLRTADYDFKKVWYSRQARTGVEDIRDTGCFCTHSNVYYTNILCHPPSLARVATDVLLPWPRRSSAGRAAADAPAPATAPKPTAPARLPVVAGVAAAQPPASGGCCGDDAPPPRV